MCVCVCSSVSSERNISIQIVFFLLAINRVVEIRWKSRAQKKKEKKINCTEIQVQFICLLIHAKIKWQHSTVLHIQKILEFVIP